MFSEALAAISRFCSSAATAGHGEVNDALYFLESLASAVAMTVDLDPITRKPRKRWKSPALLSSLAMMAIEDLSNGFERHFAEISVKAHTTSRQ